MKIKAAVLLFVMSISFCGCSIFTSEIEGTSHQSSQETSDTFENSETTTDNITEHITDTVSQEVSEIQSSAESTALSFENESTEIESVTSSEEKTSAAEKTTAAHQQVTEVELDISMPEKNGTMFTDTSSSNKFIKIVTEKKNIESDLLVAVYSVPDSGQNYVFEFYDEKGREVGDIRRVFLIDISGNISGVAASKSSERENISAVENWFCMNVLIKELVYPAVSEDLE